MENHESGLIAASNFECTFTTSRFYHVLCLNQLFQRAAAGLAPEIPGRRSLHSTARLLANRGRIPSKTSVLPDRLAVAQKFNENASLICHGRNASEAIVLTNNSAATQSYRISLEGGRANRFRSSARSADRSAGERRIAGRSPGGTERRTMVLQSGESRQLWLTVNSGDVPPGNYAAKVLLAEDGAWNATVRIPLLIRSMRRKCLKTRG